jgi:pimeloyl-ACP methyl ester carboxylesterase
MAMTQRREWILAALGAALLVCGTWLVRAERLPVRAGVLADACHTPYSRIAPMREDAAGRVLSVVVIHGLSANRRVMYSIGQKLASAGWQAWLLDSPGEGDSVEPFSFANAESCAAAAVSELAKVHLIRLQATVLVGHSLGGAIAVRLSDQWPGSVATIALAPAPMIMPRHVPANLLIIAPQLDVPQLQAAARDLLQAAGGVRDAREDFAAHRAVGFLRLPLALHGSILFDSRATNAMARWLTAATTPDSPDWAVSPASAAESSWPSRGHEWLALLGCGWGLAGIACAFPFCATLLMAAVTTSATRPADRHDSSAVVRRGGEARNPQLADLPIRPPSSTRLVFASLTLSAITAAVLLIPGVPLRALHLYSADYLASWLSLAGLFWLVLLPAAARNTASFDARALLAAILLALVLLVPSGLWLNWQLTSFWPNAARGWRLALLALVSWPYFAAEETALTAVCPHGRAKRWLLFLGFRGVLYAALALAYFAFASGEFLPLLMAPGLFCLSVAQRWGSDILRQRASCSLAAASFDAILAAWFFACVFPLT